MKPTTTFEEDKPRPHIETLAIREIKQDPEIAAREINDALVNEYAERMAADDEFPPDMFPPVGVMRDKDGVNWLFDGWHRLAAARAQKLETFACEVHQGDRRAALLASASVNATHGQRRSNLDMQKAVLKLLQDPEWSKWADREIARQCRVSHTFVAHLRFITGNVSTQRIYRTRHGTRAQMNTRGIQESNRARTPEVPFTRLPDEKISLFPPGYTPDVRHVRPTFDVIVLEACARDATSCARDATALAKKAKFATDKTLAPRLLAASRQFVRESKQFATVADELAKAAARLKSKPKPKANRRGPRSSAISPSTSP